jgi:hypothetical protein
MALFLLSFLPPGEGIAEALNRFWMNWSNNTQEG